MKLRRSPSSRTPSDRLGSLVAFGLSATLMLSACSAPSSSDGASSGTQNQASSAPSSAPEERGYIVPTEAPGQVPGTGTVKNLITATAAARAAKSKPSSDPLPTLQFPYAVKLTDGKRSAILLSVNTNTDSLRAEESFFSLRSRDGGATWTHFDEEIPFSSVHDGGDGTALSVNLRTQPMGDPAERRVLYWTTRDLGATWAKKEGVLKAPFPIHSAYFHRGIVAGKKKGTLLAAVYGRRSEKSPYETWIAVSEDGGKSWALRHTAFSPKALGWGEATHREGFDEPSLVRLPSGDLMLAVRQSAPITPGICRGKHEEGLEILTRISKDEGATWSDADQVIPVDGSRYQTADPELLVAGSRVLLASGRPDVTVAELSSSPEANVVEWTTVHRGSPGITSGYTSIVETAPGRFLQFGDYGSNWCFGVHTPAERVGIWVQEFTLR